MLMIYNIVNLRLRTHGCQTILLISQKNFIKQIKCLLSLAYEYTKLYAEYKYSYNNKCLKMLDILYMPIKTKATIKWHSLPQSPHKGGKPIVLEWIVVIAFILIAWRNYCYWFCNCTYTYVIKKAHSEIVEYIIDKPNFL